MREDAEQIIRESIAAVLPDQAVERAIHEIIIDGRIKADRMGKGIW